MTKGWATAFLGILLLVQNAQAADWLADNKRPGVLGCSDALASYNPDLHYIDRGRRENAATDNSAFIGRLVEAIASAAKWKAENGKKNTFNVVALSGGGQWGAYGAGFLNGWAAYEEKSSTSLGPFRREDTDLITGVSTGSMQLTFAYLGSSSDPVLRTQAAQSLAAEYLDPEISKLVERRGLATIPFSNSIYNTDRLVARVRDRIAKDFSLYQAMPARQRMYAGAVNLDDGQFTIADLKFLTDSVGQPEKTRRSCFASSVLASATVPLAFPPRYIDGKMYVDGGVRFGLFSSILLTNPLIVQALEKNRLNLSVAFIINGNQSSSSYADNGNKPVGEGFLDVAGATMNNMLDQLYKDSAFRGELDLASRIPAQNEGAGEDRSVGYFGSYTYVRNQDIRTLPIEVCAGFKDRMTEEQFDPKFMKCLYAIGQSRWEGERPTAWMEFTQLPLL